MNQSAIKRSLEVTNQEIEQFLAMKESTSDLRRRLDLLGQCLDALEVTIINKLEAGSNVPPGFDLKIKSTEKRYPAWKEHFISMAGKDAADVVLKSTEPKTYRNLVIKVL